MIDPKAAPDVKLKQVRKMFMQGVDHYDKIQREWHKVSRFYDNTRSVGQWESDDLDYLQSQARPAFTFNLIKSKIDTVLGIYKDAKRKAVVEPVGGEDAFLAEVLNNLVERVRADVGADKIDAQVLKTGLVKGEGNILIDAERDPDSPIGIKPILKWLSPHDVHWDPGSQEADRSDARWVFIDRWLSKGEFGREYPKFADKFDQWLGGANTVAWGGNESSEASTEGDSFQKQDDYNDEDGSSTYYFDRHRAKVRVMHCEYLIPTREAHLLDNKTMQSKPLSAKAATAAEQMLKNETIEGVEIVYAWRDICYHMHFVHGEILYEEEEPLPIKGFSIVPFTCFFDQEDGVAYGLVRNLIDSQQEVNKSHSESIEFLVGQGKTGVIAEEGAIDDVDAFEEQLQTTGTVAIVNRNALVESRVQPRTIPAMSQASAARLETSVKMLDRIAGITSDLEQPAAHAEAAVTVQLRYHKSRLALTEVFQNYECYQRTVLWKLVQLIIGSMPGQQLLDLLGNEKKFGIIQGGIVEMIEDPLGQQPPTPGREARLSDMRKLKYNVSLENTSENTSLRLMELESLQALSQLGVQIDPQVLLEKATTNRADRERLSEFASQTTAMQSKMAEDDKERIAAQTEAAIKIEAGKAEEDSRHNRVDEQIAAEKIQREYRARLAAVYERGDSAEKANMLKWLTQLVGSEQKPPARAA